MPVLPTRLAIHTALVLGAALAGLSATAASAATPVTVVLGYIPDVESFGAYYAKAKGYFADAGLDVTLIPAGTGIDQVQMVDSGQATIGIANPEQVLAATDKGVKLKVFASEFQTSPVSMTCRKDSGVTTPAELKGKRLGVKQNAELFAKLFLTKNGLSMSDVTPTTIGGSDISLIIAGKIDCMITTFAFNEPALIEQAGVPVNVLRLGDYGLNSQVDSYFVKADWYADPANQEMLVKYMKAEGKAWDEFFKDPAGLSKWFVDQAFNDGLNVEQQQFQGTTQVKYMADKVTAEKGIFWVNPATWEETAKNTVLTGAAKAVPDFSVLLTDDIMTKAALPKH
ncbi:MAG: ABC transporter substrate-binding protein [Devosia sp.]|nr:ABC transporter substrate-binding protein [Devosia sp.]